MLLEMKGGGYFVQSPCFFCHVFLIRRMVGSSMQHGRAWVAPVLQSRLFGRTSKSRGIVQQKVIWSSHALEKKAAEGCTHRLTIECKSFFLKRVRSWPHHEHIHFISCFVYVD